MVALELDQIEIDHCLECGGIWLDQGELELLLEGAQEKDALLRSFKAEKETKEAKRNCPICSRKMEKIFWQGGKKILIDKCKDNDGLWFDRGELYQVVELAEGKGNKVLSLLKDVFKSANLRTRPAH